MPDEQAQPPDPEPGDAVSTQMRIVEFCDRVVGLLESGRMGQGTPFDMGGAAVLKSLAKLIRRGTFDGTDPEAGDAIAEWLGLEGPDD